jgi:hypothetical protein
MNTINTISQQNTLLTDDTLKTISSLDKVLPDFNNFNVTTQELPIEISEDNVKSLYSLATKQMTTAINSNTPVSTTFINFAATSIDAQLK